MHSLFPRRSLSFLKGSNSSSTARSSDSHESSFPTPVNSPAGVATAAAAAIQFPPISRSNSLVLLTSPRPSKEPSKSTTCLPSNPTLTDINAATTTPTKISLIRKVSSLLTRSRTSTLTRRSTKTSNSTNPPFGPPVGHIAPKRPFKLSKYSRKRKPVLPESRTLNSSEEDEEEGEDYIDEIRRPSGLGDSVSIRSLRTMPNTCSSPYSTPDGERYNPLDDSPQEAMPHTTTKSKVTRTSSTPNLLGTYNWHGEITLPGFEFKRTSYVETPTTATGGGFTVNLGKPLPPRPSLAPELPVEVIQTILSFVPRHSVAQLARVSRLYCSAAKLVLYRHLDLENLSRWKIPSLLKLLATSSQIAELVHSFHCPDWPPATVLSPTEDDDDNNNSYLTPGDCFSYALERMGSLTSLSLPDVDSTVLSRHSAFGLTHLTFHMKEMDGEACASLLSWLDGQINITSLTFPNLHDTSSEQSPSSSSSSSSSSITSSTYRLSSLYFSRSMTSPDLHVDALEPPRMTAFLTPNPSPNGTPTTTPLSDTFPSLPTNHPLSDLQLQAASHTLLPSLTCLHATASLIELLAPSRPLKQVFLAVDRTLYSGLRPSKLMGCLVGIQSLCLRFGERVDRRTVEKFLGAVGSVLGSGGDGFSGLLELEIQVYFQDPGSEDVLYKVLHTVLPRYKHIKSIKLVRLTLAPPTFTHEPIPPLPNLSKDDDDDNTQHSPSPRRPFLSPITTPAFSSYTPSRPPHSPSRSVSLKTPTRASFVGGINILTPPPPPLPFVDYNDALTERDQLNFNLCLQQAPTLQTITLLSNSVWDRRDQD